MKLFIHELVDFLLSPLFWGPVIVAAFIVGIMIAFGLSVHAADLTIITDTQGHTGMLYDMGAVTLYGDAQGHTGQVIHGPMLDLWQFRSREGIISQGMVLPISPVEGFSPQPPTRHPVALVPVFAFPPDPCPECEEVSDDTRAQP